MDKVQNAKLLGIRFRSSTGVYKIGKHFFLSREDVRRQGYDFRELKNNLGYEFVPVASSKYIRYLTHYFNQSFIKESVNGGVIKELIRAGSIRRANKFCN